MKRVLSYSDFMKICEDKSGSMYEYGCLMLYVKIPNWSEFTNQIQSSYLYEPQNERYGLETEPHITILYGIHKDVKDEDVLETFSGINEKEFDLKLVGIDCFKNKDYDVLKINVRSEKLNELNNIAKSLPHTDTYPDYKPHLTIAYLKKGFGDMYSNKDFETSAVNLDKIVYSKTNGEKISIPLQ